MHSTGRRTMYVAAVGAASVLALVTSGAALADDPTSTTLPQQCAAPGSPAGEHVPHIGIWGNTVDGLPGAESS